MKTRLTNWMVSTLAATCLVLSGCGPSKPAQQAPAETASPVQGASGAPQRKPHTSGAIGVVTGTVVEITRSPKPGTVPYKDAIVAIHFKDIKNASGKSVPKEILVYAWGMKSNQLTAASRIEKGQSLSLALTPWDSVEEQYGGYNRIELTDPNALSLEPYWGDLKD